MKLGNILILAFFFSFCAGNDNQINNKIVLKEKCPKHIFDDLKEAQENKDCVKILFLRNQGYDFIPKEIALFKNLEELYIGVNNIKDMGVNLEILKNLRLLSLADNPISKLPENLAQLEKIEELVLLTCKLENISNIICNLKNLTELNINGNKIKDLPRCLIELPKIETIYAESISNEPNLSKERVDFLHSLNPNCKIHF